uniref:Uncharacterized protein n=1 Tax=Rhizophora mucronata TaxID=61149 RepID=A0A2P2J7T3_RHIMU
MQLSIRITWHKMDLPKRGEID